EARFSDRHIALSVFQFDDQSLICQHLAAGLGHDSPTLHLRRRQGDGLFDRFAAHADALWQAATPVWPEPALAARPAPGVLTAPAASPPGSAITPGSTAARSTATWRFRSAGSPPLPPPGACSLSAITPVV